MNKYAIVPVEPTRKMLEAGVYAGGPALHIFYSAALGKMKARWDAMLGTAPKELQASVALDDELEKLGLVRKQSLEKSEEARHSILKYLVGNDSFNADLRAGKVDISKWGLTARVTDHGMVFHIESKPQSPVHAPTG